MKASLALAIVVSFVFMPVTKAQQTLPLPEPTPGVYMAETFVEISVSAQFTKTATTITVNAKLSCTVKPGSSLFVHSGADWVQVPTLLQNNVYTGSELSGSLNITEWVTAVGVKAVSTEGAPIEQVIRGMASDPIPVGTVNYVAEGDADGDGSPDHIFVRHTEGMLEVVKDCAPLNGRFHPMASLTKKGQKFDDQLGIDSDCEPHRQ